MKTAVNLIRILTGSLFIFSGLVKAIDPRGLAYKMQEFFEAWAHDGFLPGLMDGLNDYALVFSIIMITLEVAVGLAIIIGWKKRISTWLLFLLILFFTFLTSYVLFSGKIRACGCFGDCIPLTPIQTFTKDIILLIFSLFLLFNLKKFLPWVKPLTAFLMVAGATLFTLILQFYVLRFLPVVDCLPYRKGNDILKLREMPENAIPDKFEYVFVYEKEGNRKDFLVTALPDSSWKFVERKQKLIQKGSNNVPLINDFSFTTASGNDTTAAILGQEGSYYLLFIKEINSFPEGWEGDKQLIQAIAGKQAKVFIITAQPEAVKIRYAGLKGFNGEGYSSFIFTCDATAIKTAARANPVLFLMKGPVIKEKWSWASFQNVVL